MSFFHTKDFDEKDVRASKASVENVKHIMEAVEAATGPVLAEMRDWMLLQAGVGAVSAEAVREARATLRKCKYGGAPYFEHAWLAPTTRVLDKRLAVLEVECHRREIAEEAKRLGVCPKARRKRRKRGRRP